MHLHRRLTPEECEHGDLTSIEDDIIENFFLRECQVQTIENEEFIYIGLVNKFNKPEGLGRMIFPDNKVHEGVFKNGHATGYGRRIEPNGSIFEGLYFQGIRKGRGRLIDKNGVERKGNWDHYGFEG